METLLDLAQYALFRTKIIKIVRSKDHFWMPERFFIEILQSLQSIDIKSETGKYHCYLYHRGYQVSLSNLIFLGLN